MPELYGRRQGGVNNYKRELSHISIVAFGMFQYFDGTFDFYRYFWALFGRCGRGEAVLIDYSIKYQYPAIKS
jgi:hypothetical protein